MNLEKFKPALNLLKNKYVLVLTFALVWMLFFDQFNLPSQLKLGQQINQLEKDRDFYAEQVEELRDQKKRLFSDPNELERFAREKYFMKKENEDIFVTRKSTKY